MKDRVPVNPGRVLIKPENGSSAYYATMTRADNPTQEGTPLNKNSLLKDSTAALFGLGVDAVPDDVLNAIKTLIDAANANANEKAKFVTGSYKGTGKGGESNPCSLTFDKEPLFVIMVGMADSSGVFQPIFGNHLNSTRITVVSPFWLTTSYVSGVGLGANTNGFLYGKKSPDGKTIYWYHSHSSVSAMYQENGSGFTYYYVAIFL